MVKDGSIHNQLIHNDRWQGLLWLYSKSDIEEYDTLEESLLDDDIDLQTMPKNLAGFNNHPLYALEKQCKKNEVIYPCSITDSIGTYNKMPVFPRTNVMQVSSSSGSDSIFITICFN